MIKHLKILPFHGTCAVYRTSMSFQISAFSACYKQLNVLHLKHPCVWSLPLYSIPCSFLCWRKHEVCTCKRLVRLGSGKWQFDWTQTQQNTRQAAVQLLSCLSQFPVLFFTLFWSHYMSYQSYILGETQKGEWAQSATTTEVFSQIVNVKDETRRHRYLWFWWKDIISRKSNFQFTAPKQPLKPTRWELAICHTVVSHKLQRRDLWTFSLPWWSVKHPQCTHPSSPHSGTCRCTLTLFCHSPIVKRRKKAFPKFLQSFWEESSTWDVCSVKITEYCKYTKAAVPECASCICMLKETRGTWSGTTRTFLIIPRKIT